MPRNTNGSGSAPVTTKKQEVDVSGQNSVEKSRRTGKEEVPPASQAGRTRHLLAEMKHDPDAIRRVFESGEYPYHTKMRRPEYEKQKAQLQAELLKATPPTSLQPPVNRCPTSNEVMVIPA